MFCYVKYISYEYFNTSQDDLSESSETQIPSENQVVLINPDCFIGIIMEYIFQKIGISKEKQSEYDMATDIGQPLHIKSYPPNTRGTEILVDKATYYIVFIEDMNNDTLLPVLSRLSKEFLEFTNRQSKSYSMKKKSTLRTLRSKATLASSAYVSTINVPSKIRSENTKLSTRSMITKPSSTRSVNIKLSSAHSINTKPSSTRSANTKPSSTRSVNIKLSSTHSANTKPSSTRSANTKPSSTRSANTKPSSTRSANTKPSSTRSANTKPSSTTTSLRKSHSAK